MVLTLTRRWCAAQSQDRPRPLLTMVLPAATWQPQARRRSSLMMRMRGGLGIVMLDPRSRAQMGLPCWNAAMCARRRSHRSGDVVSLVANRCRPHEQRCRSKSAGGGRSAGSDTGDGGRPADTRLVVVHRMPSLA